MIKWIDDVDKKIDATNKRIDNIVAEEVDAKNLSEVLEADAPLSKTTDLANNKVKLDINMDSAVTVTAPITKNINAESGACELALAIDSETLEVENGALKAKSSGGTQKYLHVMNFTLIYNNAYYLNTSITAVTLYSERYPGLYSILLDNGNTGTNSDNNNPYKLIVEGLDNANHILYTGYINVWVKDNSYRFAGSSVYGIDLTNGTATLISPTSVGETNITDVVREL